MTLFSGLEKLESLGLGPITFNLVPFLKSGTLGQSLCASLKELMTPGKIASVRDLEVYQHIIEHAPLQKLSIRIEGFLDKVEEDLTASRDGYAKILSALFSHIQDPLIDKPRQFHTLFLEDFDLETSRFIVPRYIDLSFLQDLSLYRCPGAGRLIPILTSHFTRHGSGLRKFWLSLSDGENGVACNIVEQFLCSFSGLKSLALFGFNDATGDRLYLGLNSSVIKKHSETLEQLALHPDGFGNWSSDGMGIQQDSFRHHLRALPEATRGSHAHAHSSRTTHERRAKEGLRAGAACNAEITQSQGASGLQLATCTG